MEVMGLMLGEFVDEYTVRVVDVFAMPQSGTAVTVEAVDPVYQKDMLDMLKQTGRHESVVGWYHSHPGFGCWLSGTDVNTAQSFEQLNKRCISVVVDPIRSVKGKVVIDAFRCISPAALMSGDGEPRQTTSIVGHLSKPTIEALSRGLNRHYYSLPINYRKNALESQMLMNVHKRKWTKGLSVARFEDASARDERLLVGIAGHAEAYATRVKDEEGKTAAENAVAAVGKVDSKKRLDADCSALFGSNIVQALGTALSSTIF